MFLDSKTEADASSGTGTGNGNGHSHTTNHAGSDNDGLYDLICVGFGPASLAIAIALHDSQIKPKPKVLYLERQNTFSWHAGMLLPGARMQISFIKDLATLRDPRSEFTFLNYLHEQGRLLQFVNLGTFLPLREEYNDYMRWCAARFEDQVSYGEEVTSVEPGSKLNPAGEVDYFNVVSKVGGIEEVRRARHVIIAVGGRPNIPQAFKLATTASKFNSEESRLLSERFRALTGTISPKIVHSSKYRVALPVVLPDRSADYKIAVVGGGQSAAEIYADIIEKYPNASTSLLIKDSALRPSDDSPFVNEIFEPSKVDEIYSMSSDTRRERISSDRATNYGVVRLELLEKLYHELYLQRLRNSDENTWKQRILPCSDVQSVSMVEGTGKVRLGVRKIRDKAYPEEPDEVNFSEYDVVFVATGYIRDVHETLLAKVKHLMMKEENAMVHKSAVERNYSVKFSQGSVSKSAGVWLQGCNESTHGLSDTLLSILSVRAGEVVSSIFGTQGGSPSEAKQLVPLPGTSIKTNNGHHNIQV